MDFCGRREGAGTFPITLEKCLIFSFGPHLLDLDPHHRPSLNPCLIFLCLSFIAVLLSIRLRIVFFNIIRLFNRVFFTFLILVCQGAVLLCSFILFLFFFESGERNLRKSSQDQQLY